MPRIMEGERNLLKKIPQRMCIVCRLMKDKRELIRVVKDKDGKIGLDNTGKAAGRGAYICNNDECIKKCRKTKALSRAFSCEVDSAVYDKLEADFIERKQ